MMYKISPNIIGHKAISKRELCNLLILAKVNFKVREVRMKDNFVNILQNEYFYEYTENDIKQLSKYQGKRVYIFQDGGNYFILEDNNFVIHSSCFEEIN